MVTFDDGLMPFRDTLPPALASLSALNTTFSLPEAEVILTPSFKTISFAAPRVRVASVLPLF
jgi:hypothetical protein